MTTNCVALQGQASNIASRLVSCRLDGLEVASNGFFLVTDISPLRQCWESYFKFLPCSGLYWKVSQLMYDHRRKAIGWYLDGRQIEYRSLLMIRAFVLTRRHRAGFKAWVTSSLRNRTISSGSLVFLFQFFDDVSFLSLSNVMLRGKQINIMIKLERPVFKKKFSSNLM